MSTLEKIWVAPFFCYKEVLLMGWQTPTFKKWGNSSRKKHKLIIDNFFFPVPNYISYPTVYQKPPRNHTRYASGLPLSLLKTRKPCFCRAFLTFTAFKACKVLPSGTTPYVNALTGIQVTRLYYYITADTKICQSEFLEKHNNHILPALSSKQQHLLLLYPILNNSSKVIFKSGNITSCNSSLFFSVIFLNKYE